MQEKPLYTVIVADDEDELREALCRMLPWEELGFSLVGSAANGLDALEMVEQLEPDLLLTDIRMPFISGIELARQVREIRPFMHIAFLSGFDDFEYAKQAIQYNIISYMLKPLTMDGLSKELRQIRRKMDEQFHAFQSRTQEQADRENFLIPLILDDYASARPEDALLEQAVESGLLQGADDRSGYVVTVTRLADDVGVNVTTPSMTQAVERIADKYLHHSSFYSGDKVVTLLWGNTSDFAEYLHILTNEIIQMSARALRRRCSVGVSREVCSLSQLHEAYQEAVEAFDYSDPDEGEVRYISDVRQLTAVHADHMTELVAKAEAAFKCGARQPLEQALAELVEAGAESKNGKGWLDMAALQLISGIYRVLYSTAGGEAMTELKSRDLLPEMNLHYTSAAALRQSLSAFCAAGMELIASQQKKGGNLLCEQALDTIEHNYADETLSLVSLSGMLHVSPNHLSACIKKYAGDTFINILIQKRMDAAKALLLQTPLKIQEIARQCGYSDQHYFSYCFKKYCGISPNQLRRQQEPGQTGGEVQ